MNDGYQVNKARDELTQVLADVVPLTHADAAKLSEALINLLKAAIPPYNYSGGLK